MSYNYLNEDSDSMFDNETNDLHNDPSLSSNLLWNNDDLSMTSNDINWNTLFDDDYDPIHDKNKDKLLDFDDNLHEFNDLFESTMKSTIKQEPIHTNSVSSSYLTDECSPNSSSNNSPVGRKVKKREFQILDSSSEKSFTLENPPKAAKIESITSLSNHQIKKESISQYPARKIFKVSRDSKFEPREPIFIGNLTNPRQIVKIRHQPNTGTPYIVGSTGNSTGPIKSVNIQKYSSHQIHPQNPKPPSFPEKVVIESATCSSASSVQHQYSPGVTEPDECDLLTGDYYDHEIDLYSDYKPRSSYIGPAGTYGSVAAQHSARGSLFQTPIPQSGPLYLTDEEKRTLLQENYPIPTRLPLTKQEERNLKKVRRKIKNKISAQESRRKKKEYVDALEKKVEAYELERLESKRRIETLETQQRTLQNHIRHIQHQMLNKITGTGNTTSTGLMLFMICFALILVGGSVPSSYRRMNLPQSSLLLSGSSLYYMGYGPSRSGPNLTEQYRYSYHTGDGGGTGNEQSAKMPGPEEVIQGSDQLQSIQMEKHKSEPFRNTEDREILPRRAILLGEEPDELNFEELVLSIRRKREALRCRESLIALPRGVSWAASAVARNSSAGRDRAAVIARLAHIHLVK